MKTSFEETMSAIELNKGTMKKLKRERNRYEDKKVKEDETEKLKRT